VKLYSERAPVFDHYGIEKDIEKALRRRVWLKSGGYIVIDHTRPSSHRRQHRQVRGQRDFEQTVLKINMEAVGEVVRQIRLRDLGGIIIIDFIDMEVLEHASRCTRPSSARWPRTRRARTCWRSPSSARGDDAQARPPGPARACSR